MNLRIYFALLILVFGCHASGSNSGPKEFYQTLKRSNARVLHNLIERMENHLQASYSMPTAHENYMLFFKYQEQGLSCLTKNAEACETLSLYNQSALGYQYKHTHSDKPEFVSRGCLLPALEAIPNKSEELKQYLERKAQVGQINPRLMAEYLYNNNIDISRDDIMRSLILTEVYINDLRNHGC